jgi:hypothetical protein
MLFLRFRFTFKTDAGPLERRQRLFYLRKFPPGIRRSHVVSFRLRFIQLLVSAEDQWVNALRLA